MKCDRLDCDVVVNLIRDALTSPTQHSNPMTPEIKVIIMLRYLQCSSYDLGLLQPSISRVIAQTITLLSQSHIVMLFISFHFIGCPHRCSRTLGCFSSPRSILKLLSPFLMLQLLCPCLKLQLQSPVSWSSSLFKHRFCSQAAVSLSLGPAPVPLFQALVPSAPSGTPASGPL